MLVDVGEVGPRPMTVVALGPTRPYSDRATVLSQCHDGSSGGSWVPRRSALAGETGPASQLAASGRSSIGAFASAPTHHPDPKAVTGVADAAGRVWPGALRRSVSDLAPPPKGRPRFRRGRRRTARQPAASRVRRVSRAAMYIHLWLKPRGVSSRPVLWMRLSLGVGWG